LDCGLYCHELYPRVLVGGQRCAVRVNAFTLTATDKLLDSREFANLYRNVSTGHSVLPQALGSCAQSSSKAALHTPLGGRLLPCHQRPPRSGLCSTPLHQVQLCWMRAREGGCQQQVCARACELRAGRLRNAGLCVHMSMINSSANEREYGVTKKKIATERRCVWQCRSGNSPPCTRLPCVDHSLQQPLKTRARAQAAQDACREMGRGSN
jgi:hypothetical protein